MLILGIDTATSCGTVALNRNDEIIFEISLKAAKGGGEYLLSSLNKFMKKVGFDLAELDLIVVGTGPGSYTGIRVGLATAQGLAEGLGKPVFGLSTLRIIAENACFSSDWVAVALDARRGEVYAALYRNTNNGLVEMKEPHSIQAESFFREITNYQDVTICGDAGKVYRSLIGNSQVKIPPCNWDRPLAGNAARIAYREWNLLSSVNLTPFYLKRVEAEIRLEERLNADKHSTNEGGGPRRSPGN